MSALYLYFLTAVTLWFWHSTEIHRLRSSRCDNSSSTEYKSLLKGYVDGGIEKVSREEAGADRCSSFPSYTGPCRGSCTEDFTESKPQLNDELLRDTFIFHCPLPNKSRNFHMKLFKGNDEVCNLYFENGISIMNKNKTDLCNPVYSGCEVKFILSNLKNKHSDSYTCCLDILVPVYNLCKSNESYLYIQDSEPCLLSEMRSWILIGLSAFSIAACICCFITCCLRKMICQHDSHGSSDYSNEYMSMAAVKLS